MEDNSTQNPIAPGISHGAIGIGRNIYKFTASFRKENRGFVFVTNGYVIEKSMSAAIRVVSDELSIDFDTDELSLQEVNGQYFFVTSRYCVGDGSLLDAKHIDADCGTDCHGRDDLPAGDSPMDRKPKINFDDDICTVYQ